MNSTTRFLVAVDSAHSWSAAFDQALALAVRAQAELVIVHAVSKDWPYSWRAAERLSALASLRERAEAQNVRVRVRSQQGDAAKIILLHARTHDPDLIVLGSHQPVGLARLRFGSVADRVVNGATCPVLLVPAGMSAPVSEFRTILYATDLSSSSSAALETAAKLQARSGARLVLAHVLHDAGLRHRTHFMVPEFGRLMGRDARERMDAMLDRHDVAADVRLTRTSAAIRDEIARLATEERADVIVMGPTRRPTLARRFLGSTPLAVSRAVSGLVLVVPTERMKRVSNEQDELVLGWAA